MPEKSSPEGAPAAEGCPACLADRRMEDASTGWGTFQFRRGKNTAQQRAGQEHEHAHAHTHTHSLSLSLHTPQAHTHSGSESIKQTNKEERGRTRLELGQRGLQPGVDHLSVRPSGASQHQRREYILHQRVQGLQRRFGHRGELRGEQHSRGSTTDTRTHALECTPFSSREFFHPHHSILSDKKNSVSSLFSLF